MRDIVIEKYYWIWILFLFHSPGVSVGQPATSNIDYTLQNTVAVDQFGRTFGPFSVERTDKQVGLFFWLWIGQPYASGVYDATEILKLPDGKALLFDFNHQNDSISPDGQSHFWGEPIWGYYNSEDEWVMRKQIQLLIQAGIDYIVFDATNVVTYRPVYLKLMAVISEYLAAGWPAPKTVFYTHSRSMQTTKQLYSELYSQALYPETWYRVDGKPLIIAYQDVADDHAEALSRGDTTYRATSYNKEIAEFFHFRKPQWPSDPFYAAGFPWIEWTFPQPVHTDVVSVTTASHPRVPMSFSLTRDLVNWGRGWDPFLEKNIAENVDQGTFFQHQWNHALNVDPAHVFVGGWNEWIAYKQPWDGEYMLCDAADKEYSRDIEPMSGGFGDAFYMQLIQNIRRYKTLQSTEETCKPEPKTIDIHAGEDQWESVTHEYQQIDKRQRERDAYGVTQSLQYVQSAPENKLQGIKVAHDEENLYMIIRTDEAIKLREHHAGWMNVFIGVDKPSLKGWEGYEFVIYRNGDDAQLTIARLTADFERKPVGRVPFDLRGNTMQIAIPREALDMNENTSSFYFKVADGIERPQDILDYYISGSAMPIGRMSYMYNLDGSDEAVN